MKARSFFIPFSLVVGILATYFLTSLPLGADATAQDESVVSEQIVADEPVSEPVAEPVADPEPVTEPVTEPTTEPVVEPVAKPVTQPAQPVAKAEPKPVEPAKTEAATAKAVEPAPAPQPVVPKDKITIGGKSIEIVRVDNTTADSGSHVNRFMGKNGEYGKFLYGHNSGAVFGNLKNLSVGTNFSVVIDGVTTNYRISNIVIFEKNRDKGTLELNGEGSYMTQVAKARHAGVQYDLSIMTCHGQSLGGGDATHRLVIFANKI